MSYRDEFYNELYHFGIPGMKWGHRKAQIVGPYKQVYKNAKQDYRDSRKAYRSIKNANKRERTATSETLYANARKDYRQSKRDYKSAKQDYKSAKKFYESEKKAEQMSTERGRRIEKAKKAAKVGAVVAGTVLAAYGAYKLNKFVRTENGNLAAKASYQAMLNASNSKQVKNLQRGAKLSGAIGMKNRSAKLSNAARNIIDTQSSKAYSKVNDANFARAAYNVYKNRRR